MKKIKQVFLLFMALVFTSLAANPRGEEILASVRSKLPLDPLTLAGSLRVRAENGFMKSRQSVAMHLDWGGNPPSARYCIGNQSLQIVWREQQPMYTLFDGEKKFDAFRPNAEIGGTGIHWTDLSFSFLWWPGARFVKEGKKINRTCYIVDVPVPDSPQTMRLWIEKKMGMLLEAHTLGVNGKRLRRMKIKSIKKTEGMWIAKDLEIDTAGSKGKTILQIDELTWDPVEELTQAEEEMSYNPVEQNNRFAIDLYKQVSASKGMQENLFFSPYSISSALVMIYGGARGNTEKQMQDVLGFVGQKQTHSAFSAWSNELNALQEKGFFDLISANALFPHKKYALLPDYTALLKETYHAELRPLDYEGNLEAARQSINEWVEQKTEEKIQNLIAEGVLNALTRSVLVNAIYFKGNWEHAFDPLKTKKELFTGLDQSVIEVPMMRIQERFDVAEEESFRAIQLPYQGGDLSMLILLPQENQLEALEEELSVDKINALNFSPRKVMLQLPKWKVTASISVDEYLKNMGMVDAFKSGVADFSSITGNKELYINSVLHKAFVEVNEDGTEAAAATAIVMGIRSIPPSFIVNRPFIYLIQEKASGSILFMGRVVDPLK